MIWGLPTPLLCFEQLLRTLAGLSVPVCQGQWGQCRAAAWLSSPWCRLPLIWGTVQAGNLEENLEGNFQALLCGT